MQNRTPRGAAPAPAASRRLTGLEALEPRVLLTSVLSYHNDAAGTGQNLTETQLTPANVNVNTFGKQFSTALDGQAYAQPLYVPGVQVPSGAFAGKHDVVYVATEHDSLYAIDAHGGTVLWRTSFIDDDTPGVAIAGATTITAVPNADVNSNDINPQVGITGTPVIDRANNALYLVTKTKQIVGGSPHYVATIFKVDIRTGAVLSSHVIGDTIYSGGAYTYRTDADASGAQDPFVPGTGAGSITVGGQQRVYFNALRQLSRPGLVLHKGRVYTAWASHGDSGPYHGWVLGFDADDLSVTAVFNTSPNGSAAGIWQSGGVISVDAQDNFYLETGNGTFDGDRSGSKTIGLNSNGFPANGNYGNAFMKLVLDAGSNAADQKVNGWGLRVADYFSPFNNHQLDSGDRDLGASGPMLLPDAVGSGTHPHLLIGGGKEGKIYLIDRDNMGKFDALTDHVVQEQAGLLSGILSTSGLFFDGQAYRLYFVGGYNGDRAKSFTIANGAFSTTPSSVSPDTFGYLPGSPSISASGTTNGIAWLIDMSSNTLRAYDARNLATELWTSNQAAGGRDALGQALKFSVATVADGEVFVGTAKALVAYGPPTPPTSGPAAASALKATAPNYKTVNLTWQDNSTNEDYFSIRRSTNNATFTEIGRAGANAQSFADTTGLLAQTTYYYRVVAHNAFGGGADSAASNTAQVTTPLPPTTGTGDGAAAAYYKDSGGQHLAGAAVLRRVDPQINFTWGTGGPGGVVGTDNFSAVWSGRIQAQFSQAYTFYTKADEGVRLFIKPAGTATWTTLVDHWNAHTAAEDSGTFTLSAGQFYDFRMEYYEVSGGAQAQLSWSSASTVKQAIPQSQLYSGVTSAAPTNLTGVAASGTQLNLSWKDNADNETGYLLQRVNPDKSVTNIPLAAGATSYMDAGLTPDSAYTYRVRASNFAADSAFTPDLTITTPVAPPTPSDAHTTAVGTNSISIAWKLNSTKLSNRETGIAIYRKTGDNGVFLVIADLPPGTTSYADSGPGGAGLKPGTKYDYHVQAHNAAGYSDFTGVNTQTLTVGADAKPPTATLETAVRIRRAGGAFYKFVVRYTDASGVNAELVESSDVDVTGPGGFSSGVRLLSKTVSNGGKTVDAFYRLAARGGTWDRGDNGVYTVNLKAGQVADAVGNFAAAAPVGQFTVRIPRVVPTAVPAGAAAAPRGMFATRLLAKRGADDDLFI